jgi:hypothetical protein
MALTFIKLFQPSQLPITTPAVIYTCPASPATSVLKNGRVRLVNTSAAAVPATLYAVPSGGTASAANEFLPATSIAVNGYLDIDIPDMAAGDTLQGFAGAATSITIHEMGGVLYS